MGTSYEEQIVTAMLQRLEALEKGDDQAAAEALVRAGEATRRLRTRRRAVPPQHSER